MIYSLRVVLSSVVLLPALSAQMLFEAPVNHPFTGGAAYSLILGDVDGDGDDDALISGSAYDVSVLVNDGGGSLTAPVGLVNSHAYDIALADLDADGDLDLAFASDVLQVALNDGSGGFGAPVVVYSHATLAIRALAVADADGDGILDLVALVGGTSLVASGSVELLLGVGDGSFGPVATVATYSNRVPVSAFVAQMDGQGASDLVVVVDDRPWTTTMVYVYPGQGAGVFGSPTIATLGTPAWIAAGDLNGDAVPDLVAATMLGVAVRIASGSGGFLPASVDTSVGPVTRPAVGDFDLDGDLDFVTSTFFDSGDLVFFAGNGSGGFAQELVVGQGTSGVLGSGMAAADMDADGRLDVVAVNTVPVGVEVCRNHTYAASDPFTNLGNVFGYQDGAEHVSPIHVVDGTVVAGQTLTWSLQNVTGPPTAAAWLVFGLSALMVPFKGGVLVPAPDLLIGPFPLGGATSLDLSDVWPPQLPSGMSLWSQYWLQGVSTTSGLAASGAIVTTTP